MTETGLAVLSSRLPWALAISGSMAALAYGLHTVGRSGAVLGFVFGVGVYVLAGPRPFFLMAVFFLLGSLVTRWGWAAKEARGVAEERGGARGAAHVLANGAPVLALALGSFITGSSHLFCVGIAGALAAALTDTASSEIGQVYGSRPVSLASFRTVPVGTPGAVSLQGTASGLAAAIVMGILAIGLGVVSWRALLAVAAGAVFASAVESVLACRASWAGHHGLNLVNVSLGACLAMAIWKLAF